MKTTIKIITILSILFSLLTSCIGLNQIHPEKYKVDEDSFLVYGAKNLSKVGIANCYIVSEAGTYSFPIVKGNSYESVGEVMNAEVLWESYGTSIEPTIGSLVASVGFQGKVIVFNVPSPFKEGNAVIAAKDASGKILWSWHIWLTDQPEGQVYYNNEGIVMDRNLGATSAIPGDVGALGLFYQWGRKDPFLGSSSINSNVEAKSTITWPSAVSSNSTNGTIYYATEHPTTFIKYNSINNDWYYTGSSSTDNTRWQSEKTIYDPCPAGWRVPDGGRNGIWSNALGSPLTIYDESLYDNTNKGINFSGNFGSASTIWYPSSGYRYTSSSCASVGSSGFYWSVSPFGSESYYLNFFYGCIEIFTSDSRANGYSVRCVREIGGDLAEEDKDSDSGDDEVFTSEAVSLSDIGTANSYIVSESGTYSIPAVKGNSSESVGPVSRVDVLWESVGTETTTLLGNLVKKVLYKNGQIYIKTADAFKEGNAVIAAKDASGKILWSWHIWLTDEPQEQVYYNNAGTMMDRNLGATSATIGNVDALGLLYQWGRKDPFLGPSSISSSTVAKSTITWPSAVSSNSTNGTIYYATEHPTTFIKYNSINNDWYYTGSSSTDNTRWQSEKTIYDPCPAGWRVPDGGRNGIWSNALGSPLTIYDESLYDNTNKGINFSGNFGSASTIWYPASGYRGYDGSLYNVGYNGYYWSVSPSSDDACFLYFSNYGNVNPLGNFDRALGLSVRCIKEETGVSEPDFSEDEISTSEALSLSDGGSANSYVVSESGTYSIPAVKGNSSESVGSVVDVEILWESFGTDVTPSMGNLVKAAVYKNGQIYFKTADAFKEGNAVIAAKDASGTILWSWHIWLTDHPEEQVYYNNAGTMMDRNLGATSATPGDVGSLGLLYQWGRKDPFLGSSSISSSTVAKSTITWPSVVSSTSSNGTIAYATEHPTTFITYNSNNGDWYYTASSSTDNTRWQSDKTIYDPCPSGWRVPDGGSSGVWSESLGYSSPFIDESLYDAINMGMDFSNKFGSASIIWYPATGFRYNYDASLLSVGYGGLYWSVSPYGYDAYFLDFSSNGGIDQSSNFTARSYGHAVRCARES